ncbi:MAG: T9SS C-terminal target domain-containing protein [Bacteroidetes bacterium]|nr:MAG: T9SS C-terminal target domain-containing protein [Bacteroidota bacterium]
MYDQIIIFPDFAPRTQDNIVYFDNITFNAEAIEDGTDATLSDLMVNGTTVSGFSPSVLNYSVVLPEGITDVPVVTATTNDPDANAVITPATELPGTTSVLVTSANTEVEQTYTIAFSIGAIPTEPEVAAPAPPALAAENVVSIFSDAFANVEGTNFNPDWGQTTMVSIVEIQGNETLKYANFNFQGTQFDGSLNVSDMEYLHLDMWTADATSVNVFTISPGPVETGIALAITPGQWVSYDIPLSEFANVDMTDLIQFKFDGGDGTPTIYLDNLYFFKDPTSVGSVEQDKLILYPNPAEAGSKLHLSKEALQVDIYDLTGKSIVSGHNTSTIDTYGMKQGIYMVRIVTHSGLIETHKLVVK